MARSDTRDRHLRPVFRVTLTEASQMPAVTNQIAQLVKGTWGRVAHWL